jgi:hypothetical protein
MKKTRRTGLGFLVVCGILTMSGALALAKDSPKLGTHKDWNDLDKVVVKEVFKLADYSLVRVVPFDTKATPLPAKEDNTYAAVTEALQVFTARLVAKMQDELREPKVELLESAAAPAEGKAKTLLIRGRVTEMNPGSEAARFFGGFGAGHSRVEIVCEVVDAQTDKVLVVMNQGRASSGSKGYDKILKGDTQDLGEDVAKLLKSFQ